MKIISLLSTIACLAASLCHSYPTSLAILHHPVTKARVVLIGDRHYTIDDAQEQAKENAFEQFLPQLHHHIATFGYTFLFEGNEYDEQQAQKFHAQHPTLETKGLQKLSLQYALYKNVLPHYKPCDPRIKNIKIFTRMHDFFNKIINGVYNDIVTHLTTCYTTATNTAYKKQLQVWLNDVIFAEDYPSSCLNYFLHEQKNTPITSTFLLTSLTRHVCNELFTTPQELATVTPANLFLDLELLKSSLYNGLLRHELLTPYKKCAVHIKNTYETFMHSLSLFKNHWQGVEKIPLLQALMTLIAKNEHNDLGFLCGHNRSNNEPSNTSNFYTQLLTTTADTSMCLTVLNHQKSVLYAGSAHCSAVKNFLETDGFICTFYHNTKETPITDFNTFYTALRQLQ